MGRKARVDLLIEILQDSDADISTRDDAAMYLAEFDEPKAEEALFQAALSPGQHRIVIERCGESLGEIWLRTGSFEPKRFALLPPMAQLEAGDLIRRSRPEWLDPNSH